MSCAAAQGSDELRLQGNAAFKEGQLQAALQLYKAAADIDPCDPLLYSNISLVELKLGHVNEVGSRLHQGLHSAAALFL
jgi:Flp pilus assembly protein TadD